MVSSGASDLQSVLLILMSPPPIGKGRDFSNNTCLQIVIVWVRITEKVKVEGHICTCLMADAYNSTVCCAFYWKLAACNKSQCFATATFLVLIDHPWSGMVYNFHRGCLSVCMYSMYVVCMYTVSQKNCVTIHWFITSTNVGRFSKFFYCCILQEICNNKHSTLRTTP